VPYKWNNVYPELVNKLRWAIVTSVKTEASNFNYSLGQRIATVVAQDVVAIIRTWEEAPEVLSTIDTIRGCLMQVDAEREVSRALTLDD